MNAFATAIDVLFANPEIAGDAAYTPAGGVSVTVRAVLDRPDKEIDVGISGIQAPSWKADVRAADLPAGAAKGDAFEVGGARFVVRGIRFDALRLVATLDLDPV